jgi:hypothetical protein
MVPATRSGWNAVLGSGACTYATGTWTLDRCEYQQRRHRYDRDRPSAGIGGLRREFKRRPVAILQG